MDNSGLSCKIGTKEWFSKIKQINHIYKTSFWTTVYTINNFCQGFVFYEELSYILSFYSSQKSYEIVKHLHHSMKSYYAYFPNEKIEGNLCD